jgi:uncharacterized protein
MSGANLVNEEVSWNVMDIPVHGTITAPEDGEASAAVIFLAGSGPTDRDWCTPLIPGSNGSGKLLAEFLASRGFVTLRYDKLGSGPRVRENFPKFVGKVSMQAFVNELFGAVETVLSERSAMKNNLFALTNSEGSIHAVNYQLQAKSTRFKGLVLTGAPGRVVGELARNQILDQMSFFTQAPCAAGLATEPDSGTKPPLDAEGLMKHYDQAIADFVAGKPVHLDESLPKGLNDMLLAVTMPANQPFSRELWTYSLPEYLSRVNDPTLVVIGKKDIQVDWKVDGKALEVAMANKGTVTFAYPEDANHVLKHEERPRDTLDAEYVCSNYNAPSAQLDEEAAGLILDWLANQSRSRKC